MKKYNYLIVTLLAAGLAACSNQDEDLMSVYQQDSDAVRVTATIAGIAETRANTAASGNAWDDGDQICVTSTTADVYQARLPTNTIATTKHGNRPKRGTSYGQTEQIHSRHTIQLPTMLRTPRSYYPPTRAAALPPMPTTLGRPIGCWQRKQISLNLPMVN